jgi:hypothetical protein
VCNRGFIICHCHCLSQHVLYPLLHPLVATELFPRVTRQAHCALLLLLLLLLLLCVLCLRVQQHVAASVPLLLLLGLLWLVQRSRPRWGWGGLSTLLLEPSTSLCLPLLLLLL